MGTSVSCPSGERLAAFRRGDLPGDALEAVAKHVIACPRCQQTLGTFQGEAEGDAAARLFHGRPTEAQAPYQAAPGDETQSKAPPTGVPENLPPTRSHGQDPPAPPRDPTPSSVGPYQLVRELGRGGMGAVYLAIHKRLKKWVAVKVLPAERVNVPEAVSRFHREMEALGGLAHPNIVGATDAGEADGLHFLVMEYVDGVDLAALVRLRGPLSVADAAEAIRQAATGLQYIHENGRVHRDVKPSNLMLSTAGEVKILDLGLALLHGDPPDADELTATGDVMGTADYMAPEQWLDSHRVDIRADVYSLGCTLYKVLTGKAPFSNSACALPLSKRERHAQLPVPVIDARPDLPEAFRAALFRMLAKAPEDRFAVPGEVVEAMQPFTPGSDLRRLVSEARLEKGRAPGSTPFGAAPRGPEAGSPTPGPAGGSDPQAPTILGPQSRRRRWAWRAAVAAGLAGAAGLATVLALAFWPTPSPRPVTQPAEPSPGPPKIAPVPLLWPNNGLNSEWRWNPALSELYDQCDGEGLIRLGDPPGEDYEIQIDLYQTQWGGAGLFFGRHPDLLGGKPCDLFQVLALARVQLAAGQEQFFLEWTERRQAPDGSAALSAAALAPIHSPDKSDQHLAVSVKEGKLRAVVWDGNDLLPVLRDQHSPAPQLLPTGSSCAGAWGAYSCLGAAYFRRPRCLSPGDS